VDRDKGADAKAARCRVTGRAEASLEIGGSRAESRAGAAESKIVVGVACGAITQMPIDRLAAKVFVAAVQKIEKDRARHDRHFDVAHDVAAAALAEKGRDSAHRIEAINGAARKNQGI